VGLFGRRNEPALTEQDLENGMTSRTASAVLRKLMDVGLDGLGPIDSAARVVDAALEAEKTPEKAIDLVVRKHQRYAASNGFITGLGGLFTMIVALPANVTGFYVVATRMVGSIAAIRGYDLNKPEVRTAILLALVGADSEDVLRKAGITSGGKLAQMAMGRLPKAALMVVNKAVAFRVSTLMGARTLGRMGRLVPVVGGFVGAGLDAYLITRIANHARQEFPPVAAVVAD
jgi:hypothetical protein